MIDPFIHSYYVLIIGKLPGTPWHSVGGTKLYAWALLARSTQLGQGDWTSTCDCAVVESLLGEGSKQLSQESNFIGLPT